MSLSDWSVITQGKFFTKYNSGETNVAEHLNNKTIIIKQISNTCSYSYKYISKVY